MPGRLRPRRAFAPAWRALPRPARCMANAAATWCWATAWSMLRAFATPCSGFSAMQQALQSRKLHLGYRRARLRFDGPLGAAGAVIRGHEFHYASLLEAGDDEGFADLADADGKALGRGGGRRGSVTGTFFHAVAAETACERPAAE